MKLPAILSLGLFLIILAVGVSQMGCKGEKGDTGPAGPGGGKDTVYFDPRQLEGFAPGIVCGSCHNPDQDTTYYVWARKYQWELSKHFYGGDYERSQADCAGCHTTEGFIQAMFGRTVTTHVNASPPGCFACHSPHARGDFSLRNEAAVTLTSPIQGVADVSFDYGKGNLCAQCHKPRTLSPKPDPTKTAATDTISITSNRWYPHYGVQSQMLMGTGGFKFSDYTYTGNSNHTDNLVIKQEGCIACHMADPVAGSGIAGGHTMNINYTNTSGASAYLVTGCIVSGCHNPTFNINTHVGASDSLTGGMGVKPAVHAYLDTLQTMLLDTAVVNKWNAGAKKAWIAVSSSGSITVNASTSSPLKISPASRAGALFNFFFVEHDLSEGGHNSKYALELLKSSVIELRK
jgi:hypothetical protein